MTVLEVENIVKEYRIPGQPPIRVLDGVSFSVEEGERVAVTGRSGAGKTTLLNVLGGLDRPDEGCGAQIEVAGRDLLGAGERGRARLRAEAIGFDECIRKKNDIIKFTSKYKKNFL